ncbi:sulfatase-like hydrolase/transferase [Leptospira sp. 201903075]|nr:sulfatase-like hydrolase/transferase [Leptospira chreensis]MBM9592726.1 sulfatase-like hydrolase/transferase [Leptospira chreensis]
MAIFYSFSYFLYGFISFSFGVWIFFHGVFITLFSILVLLIDFFLDHNWNKNFKLNTIFRLVLWTLFVMAFSYQEVYQTALTLDLLIYFFQHISLLYSDLFNFLLEWKLIQWMALGIGFYLIVWNPEKEQKRHWFLLSFGLLLLVFLRSGSWMNPDLSWNQNQKAPNNVQRVKSNLESISGKPNLVLVLLEGVPRKHLVKIKSRYINFSNLEGSHFWIPMPHTSKSLFTWMTGISQLNHTRLQLDGSVMESNLPKQLERTHNYHTSMIYTQSIFFEGMDQFFPKIFQTVWEKGDLEKRYGGLYPSFSWGMDDRVVLPALKQTSDFSKQPLFVLIGLSQTHSPYFVSNEKSRVSFRSPLDRYMVSLEEEVEVLDSIISYWKENSSRETVLILSADHGESFGEEGAHAHNYSLYNQETDVPFLLYFIKSGQLYIPKLGTSVDFKDTILSLLETHSNQKEEILKSNFFSPDYSPNLVLKTWNSEIQKSWITEGKKYIYHSDRDLLIETDFMEEKRVPITNSLLKKKVLDEIYSNIR